MRSGPPTGGPGSRMYLSRLESRISVDSTSLSLLLFFYLVLLLFLSDQLSANGLFSDSWPRKLPSIFC